jgi:biotin synthase-related radical SAM superfamily protein
MSIIFDVLDEEYNRLKELWEKYQNEIDKLPKGSIQKKQRNGKAYIYLYYRNGDKVISKYIGKEKSRKVDEIKEELEKRKEYERKMKKVKADLKEIERAFNGRAS